MALQKWAAPAGTPLLTTQTATGNPGAQGRAGIYVEFAASGDISVGSTVAGRAHGLITTTGARTFTYLAGFMSDLETGSGLTTSNLGFGGYSTLTTQSSLTASPWSIEFVATAVSESEVRYRLIVHGVAATDHEAVGTVNPSGFFATWGIAVGWDVTANNATSGDIATMVQADAIWIG